MSSSPVSDRIETIHPVDAWMAENGAEFLDHMNGDFADAIVMVARGLTEHRDATAAVLIGLDPAGIDADVTDAEGQHRVRVLFEQPLEHAEDITMALLGLTGRARDVLGDAAEPTSGDRELEELSRIRTFLAHVVAVEDVNPHLRKVTFGGPDLAEFEPAGPDTFLYLLLPPAGRDELTVDRSFSWEDYARTPDEEKPTGAYYTLRHWRPDVHEIDVLMVLHDDHGSDGGHASRWAARAQPGDEVALWGPRTAYEPPEATEHLVLVADETGLPAVAGILEQMPDGTTATVVAEVASLDERQELPARDGVTVTWLHRDGAEAGTTTGLADTVRSLPPFERPTYVWGGGESRTMTAVRRHVRDDRGLERAEVSLVAYWRHARSPADEND